MDAKKYFELRLSNLSLSEILEIKDKLNKTKLLTYSVEDNAEATLIFETTNDRGKTLTNLEKIKSFLMYKCYISTEEPSDILKRVYRRFSDIYSILELIDVDNEDSILQYHFIAFENWSTKKDYQEYLQMIKNNINQLILDKNRPCSRPLFFLKPNARFYISRGRGVKLLSQGIRIFHL
mgnify:CR=1 FL=1